MKCEFSETQFAFFYTFEILKKYPNKLLSPWFPTTVEEGRSGGGFDAELQYTSDFRKDVQKISGSLFLQFKRPDCLRGRPSYRIKIDGKQLELLKQLKRPANMVFYCAPLFHEKAKIMTYYFGDEIEAHSVLFPIEEFEDVTGDHKLRYVCGDDNTTKKKLAESELRGGVTGRYGILNSEPQNIRVVPNILSERYKPDPMSLSEKASILFGIIKNVDDGINNVSNGGNIIKLVFSFLLIQHNILWIPLL